MRVCVVGTGYVGLVTGACLAEIGHTVICVDNDDEKIARLLSERTAPFYEPALNGIIQVAMETASGTNERNLDFTASLKDALDKDPDIIFVCVGTPAIRSQELDLRFIEEVCAEIARHSIQAYVVIKSTVPPGTCRKMRKLVDDIRAGLNPLKDIIFNPEFLKEGHAVEDFRKPDRIVVGSETESGFGVMQDLYSHFIRNGHKYIEMGWESAEMTKLAANSMLATRISFMNEMAGICEQVGADIMDVRQGIGSDSRIGMQFLYAGLGFGGSCFPKDVTQLCHTPDAHGDESCILHAVLLANSRVLTNFCYKIVQEFVEREDKPVIAVWGLSFKPKTDDVRAAPAVRLITMLLPEVKEVRVYDPIVKEKPERIRDDRVVLCESKYDACVGAHALVLCTEWAQFRKPDWFTIKRVMKEPRIFDGRNQWDPADLIRIGFDYHGIGRCTPA